MWWWKWTVFVTIILFRHHCNHHYHHLHYSTSTTSFHSPLQPQTLHPPSISRQHRLHIPAPHHITVNHNNHEHTRTVPSISRINKVITYTWSNWSTTKPFTLLHQFSHVKPSSKKQHFITLKWKIINNNLRTRTLENIISVKP